MRGFQCQNKLYKYGINSCIKIVRTRQPCSNLYLFVNSVLIIIFKVSINDYVCKISCNDDIIRNASNNDYM